jgi:hypothetical protein
MDYDELKQAIADFMENDEETFLDYIDLFIRHGEQSLVQLMEFPSLRKNTKAKTFTNGVYEMTMPDDFVAFFSFAVIDGGKYKFLEMKEDGYMRMVFDDPTEKARPVYYEVMKEKTIEVAPTPDKTYTTDIWYYSLPESIVDSLTGESFLTRNCSEALLYCCLINAALYLKLDEDTLKALYEKRNEALQGLEGIDMGRITVDLTRREWRRKYE